MEKQTNNVEQTTAKKVELRRWYIQDKEAFMRINDSVDSTYDDHFVGYPCSVDEAINWIMFMVDKEFDGGGMYRAILIDGVIKGLVSVSFTEGNHWVDGSLGIMMMPESCGKGIATQAVKLMVDEVFSKTPIERISSVVYEPNIASARVLEKNGFVLEGRKANAVKSKGVVYNTLLYGLLRETTGRNYIGDMQKTSINQLK